MSSTLLQLRDLIKSNNGIVNDPKFPDSLINRWLNDSQRTIQGKVFSLGYKEFKDTDSLVLSSGYFGATAVMVSPLSTECINRMAIPNWLLYIETAIGSSSKGVAYPIPDSEFNERLLNSFLSPTVSKPICTIINDLIYIAPSTIDTASAHYYKDTTDMASDASTLDLPESLAPQVIKLVEMRIHDRRDKLGNLDEKMKELDKEIADALKAFEIQKVEEPQIMRLV